jgi:hypothetical protein
MALNHRGGPCVHELTCSDFLNMAEFIEAVFAVRCLGPEYLNVLQEPMALQGDSIAALT